ncbi:MAG TPA: GNAT family N-acetyltransferase [Sphingomicrobium sp.]|nr:GNAT family N-acetyltransferase [Sphingomicrobium sp.]
MHAIRLAVRENELSDPGGIGQGCYVPFVKAGSAWVAVAGGQIVGFAVLDVARASVWALFVDPDAEGRGVGRRLHARLIEAARERRLPRLILTTSPRTRAERFYRISGWMVVGGTDSGELRMERLI